MMNFERIIKDKNVVSFKDLFVMDLFWYETPSDDMLMIKLNHVPDSNTSMYNAVNIESGTWYSFQGKEKVKKADYSFEVYN